MAIQNFKDFWSLIRIKAPVENYQCNHNQPTGDAAYQFVNASSMSAY